jgi:hypothetical protein
MLIHRTKPEGPSNLVIRCLLVLVLVLVLLLSGCRCGLDHRLESNVVYQEQNQKIYALYSAYDVERLERLLNADSWLQEHDEKCRLLTPEESRVLENRIRLIKSMLDIIRAVR